MKYYMVGGYVRDKLLGIRSKDIDFAVEANSYEEMRNDLLVKGILFFQERPEFLSIRARHPELGGVDYTVCRKDGFYSDARHPDIVHIGTIYDDLSRRDFTVNAIALTEDGELYDPFNGRDDLNNKVLRCVGDPFDRIAEDPLRILRAARFSVTRGFGIHSSLREAIKVNKFLLTTLPKERIYEELKLMFRTSTTETLGTLISLNIYYTLFWIIEMKLEPAI